MSRTTDALVREISDIDPKLTDLSPFITAAGIIITQWCTDIDDSPEIAAEVERWLTAHLVTIRDPKAQSEGVGSISNSYQGSTGMGLQSSFYGQNAMLLDITGGPA
jgi:hypothetical protein